jgi:hypothetical protein
MFNPANFALNQHLEDSAAQAERGMDPVTPSGKLAHAMIRELEQAAARYALRRDSFAAGKSDTCLDIAAKLDRFGSFASERQAAYAEKLVEWSKPREAAAWDHAERNAWNPEPRQEFTLGAIPKGVTPAQAPAPAQAPTFPKLFTLMQRLAKLEIGAVTIARKNGDSLCWVKLAGTEGVVGKLTNGGALTLFARCPQPGNLLASLSTIEEDPEAAAARHGRASGRCSVCSRDLTDPESIERGIGPICAGKFSF